MQNDTISRSALVADLEGLKLSLGDVFFQMVIDRVIERVKAQPPAPEPEFELDSGGLRITYPDGRTGVFV